MPIPRDVVYPICLMRVLFAEIKHEDQKRLGKERIYFKLTVPHDSPSSDEVRTGSEGRSLKAQTKAEAMEEFCLLACSS